MTNITQMFFSELERQAHDASLSVLTEHTNGTAVYVDLTDGFTPLTGFKFGFGTGTTVHLSRLLSKDPDCPIDKSDRNHAGQRYEGAEIPAVITAIIKHALNKKEN